MRGILIALGLAVLNTAHAQTFENIEVLKVAAQMHFTEGPVWSADGFLLYTDTTQDKIYKFIPGVSNGPFQDRPNGAICNMYDGDGRLYTCEFRERRITRTAKNGKVEVIAAKFEGKRLNSPNDLVLRKDGQLYFTDPAFGAEDDAKELDFYGIFHVTPKGEIEAVARWKTRPDGITLSPNGRILYVSDADRRMVRAFDLDGKGTASNERTVLEKIPGVPGGLRTDEKGNLYVAAKSVYVYSLASATAPKLLGEFPFTEPPSNLTFGDPDLQSLYVTVRTGVYRLRIGVKGASQY